MRDFEVGEKVKVVDNQELVTGWIKEAGAGACSVNTEKGHNHMYSKHEIMPFATCNVGADAIAAKVEFIKDEERKLKSLTDMFEVVKNEDDKFYIEVSHSDHRRDTSYSCTQSDMDAIRLGYELEVDAQIDKVLSLKAELERGDYSVDKTD